MCKQHYKIYGTGKLSYKFKSKVQERAWRMKNRAKHKLVWNDDYGPYFYSEVYTETDFGIPIKRRTTKKNICIPVIGQFNQLVVYNNQSFTQA